MNGRISSYRQLALTNDSFGPPLHLSLTRFFLGGCVMLCLLIGSGAPSGFAEDTSKPHELPRPKFKSSLPLFQEWNFDQSPENDQPIGFQFLTIGGNTTPQWRVLTDSAAPSRPHILSQSAGCASPSCFQVLISESAPLEYFDLSVRLHALSGTTGGGGLFFGKKDGSNFYAITVNPQVNTLTVELVQDGRTTSLSHAPLHPRTDDWYFLRMQRNTIISQELIEIFFDNQLILSLSDPTIREGEIGVVTSGDASFAFDNLRAMELLTSRPLSRPPAY